MEEEKQEQEAPKETPKKEDADVEQYKAMAIVGYILPVLFFIPLLSEAKNSPFAKFHANQQLNLLLFWLVGGIAVMISSFILAITIILIPLAVLLWFAFKISIVVLIILGIINAGKGEMKKLPIIGEFELIK
ncbi:MAG: hypothetical protein ACD_67C00219G0001 [uncultured bacterium]|nr:MAG: hypothetical protein ACD_67C00219G0001 [uncultured bacterium]